MLESDRAPLTKHLLHPCLLTNYTQLPRAIHWTPYVWLAHRTQALCHKPKPNPWVVTSPGKGIFDMPRQNSVRLLHAWQGPDSPLLYSFFLYYSTTLLSDQCGNSVRVESGPLYINGSFEVMHVTLHGKNSSFKKKKAYKRTFKVRARKHTSQFHSALPVRQNR